MPQTHYYYALNRKAAERVFDLTWNQFLAKFGWSKRRSQWPNIGGYLAFFLDKPELPDEPTAKEIAPILRRTIRETMRHMSPEYFCILELSYQLGKRSFIRADIDAVKLEDDCQAFMNCAISLFLSGRIDDRTLWCVFMLPEEWFPVKWSSDFVVSWTEGLTKVQRRRVHAAVRRFGRCRPIFDWQPVSAVRDGHTALCEKDTRRFVRFVRLAWRQNWPLYQRDSHLVCFRSLKLARKLHAACPALLGNCLVHYWGP
jgi:hypothetical protein